MGSPTIGMQIAAIFQFIGMMVLISPLTSMILPNQVNVIYYDPTNGIVNGTYQTYLTTFHTPVLMTANSSVGFAAYGSSTASSFSVLSFVYGGLGLLWKSMLNFPNMLLVIFTGVSSNIYFFPLAVTVGASSIAVLFVAYIQIGNFWKFLSGLQKTDMENVGG